MSLLILVYIALCIAGLVPLAVVLLLIRKSRLSRLAKGFVCALFAATTATPVFLSFGLVVGVAPLSFGLLVPQALHWTLTEIVPAKPLFHLVSLVVTTLLGFYSGWFLGSANNSFKPKPLRGSA